MTAQAPYESLTPDEAAQRLRLIGNECRARCKSKGVDCGTCARSDAAIEMAIAALPERAPVSAGGDDLMLVPRSVLMTAGTLLQQSANVIDRREGAALLSHARGSATPAPPVGADWVMVPRMLAIAAGTVLQQSACKQNRHNGGELLRHSRGAAAPTPAEARGVGDGVRAQAIRLTRSPSGVCEVSIEANAGEWVTIIRDSGEVISHIVEPSGIAAALAANRGVK